MCGVFKIWSFERSCKCRLVWNGSSLMPGLGSSYVEVEFVALCSCSDINVSKLCRLCTGHSYLRYIAKPVNEIANFKDTMKVNQSLYRPWGFHDVEVPRLQGNRHMNVVRLSALRIYRLYPPVNITGAHFC